MENLVKQFSQVKPGDVGIIGDPVEHSLSPVFHNAAFKTWWGAFRDRDELTPVYHRFHVLHDQLAEAVDLAKKHQLRGLNVTIPHKETVIKFVDNLDPAAERLGAVNTLSFQEGKVKGFNTDVDGFRRSLERELEFDPEGKPALILGAGGTGKIIALQLINQGASMVYIWNRDPQRLRKFFDWDSDLVSRIKIVESEDELGSVSREVPLIINATSVGLKEKDLLPSSKIEFNKDHYVFDVIYHRETFFMKSAKQAGAKVIGGLGMLLFQGAKSFEIWTGAPAPLDIMRQALQSKMEGK